MKENNILSGDFAAALCLKGTLHNFNSYKSSKREPQQSFIYLVFLKNEVIGGKMFKRTERNRIRLNIVISNHLK